MAYVVASSKRYTCDAGCGVSADAPVKGGIPPGWWAIRGGGGFSIVMFGQREFKVVSGEFCSSSCVTFHIIKGVTAIQLRAPAGG